MTDRKGKGPAPVDASQPEPSNSNAVEDWPDFIPEDNEGGFFSVAPKMDCPHIGTSAAMSLLSEGTVVSVGDPCVDCGSTNENWLCLKCHKVLCSR
jgi:uncharacterized UBP type Zn finger protein